MAQEADKDSKSEDPTEKKISDTLEKGNVAFSKEVTNVFSLIAMVLVGYLFLPAMMLEFGMILKNILANSRNWPLDTGENAARISDLVGMKILRGMAPVILPIALFGLVSSLMQNTPRMVLNRIQPKFERISLAKGLKRMLGPQGVREFTKALFKFIAAGSIAMIIALSHSELVFSAILIDTQAIAAIIYQLFIQVLIGLTLTMSVLGLVDYIWVRREWFDGMKMTHQEIKDERKQSEGDPMIKMRTRSIAQDRARRRMISQVKDANIVVVNPTHFAVAMRYKSEIDKVPIVLAKGQDLIALKIREMAEECDIEITEDPVLARALYKVVEVDMEIPVEFYLPLAKIIRALGVGTENPQLKNS